MVPDNDGRNNRAATSAHLLPYKDKVVRCTSSDEVEIFLASMS